MATYFVHDSTHDVAATRRFYGDLLGLKLLWDADDVVAFEHDGVQISFGHAPDAPIFDGWAFQPGWCLGQLDGAPPVTRQRSCSFALGPDAFREAVTRLQDASVEALRPEPFWVGYWSFVVRDPSGATVELSDPQTPGPEA